LFAVAITCGQTGSLSNESEISVVRFVRNPIITKELSASLGENINGPSLIRVPSWLPKPLGRYYLYFAHHNGKFIRLAYADRLEGPWSIYEPGTLKLSETPCTSHIASPDIHIDEKNRVIRMYFHGPVQGGRQVSFVATSNDGLRFEASKEILGDSYFRLFEWRGCWYAMARTGVLYRSRDGLTNFEPGGNPLRLDTTRTEARHVALKLDGAVLSVFHSNIGDSPERVLLSKIRLTEDWNSWRAAEPVTVLWPETPYEGIDLPLRPSQSGASVGRMRELRDPAIYREGSRCYLLYTVAGENGIAIAEIKEKNLKERR
jgi:hypothetical protein